MALLHCAAGFHRTGLNCYTLLRLLGKLTPDEAYKAIKEMREATYYEVLDWRIDLAEKHIVSHFLFPR